MDLLFTDLHLDARTQFSTLSRGGLNSRLLDQLRVINEVKRIAEERKVDRIFFLGDLLNGLSESLSKTIFNAAYYIAKLLSECSPVWFIIGNHDVFRRLTVLSNFASLPMVRVIEETETLEDGIDLIPWEGKIPEQKSKTLFGHVALKGAWVDKNCSVFAEDGTAPVSLFGYNFIFLGHFHSRQNLEIKGATEAMYISSVMQNSFAEAPEKHGVTLFDGKKSEFMPIDSPKLLAYEIKDQNAADLIVESINSSKDYYKLIITNNGITLPDFDHRVDVEYNISVVKESRLKEQKGEDIWETVERFINEVNTSINRKEAIKLLKEVT